MSKLSSISILAETNEYMALNKPAGLLVHPKSNKDSEVTLIDILGSEVKSSASINRSGLVHRLDRDTTGVILIAKSGESHDYLKNLFRSHEIKKTYIALVEGVVDPRIEMIDLPLRRSPLNKLKREVSPIGKSAQTVIAKTISKSGTSLVWLEPRTGRTNQLRAHLAHIGHPIISDILYGSKKTSPRYMLHAYSVEFKDPSGKLIKIVAPIPSDMRDLSKKLGYDIDENS